MRGFVEIANGVACYLNNQWTFRIVGFFRSVVFHPATPVVAQVVKPQAVGFWICYGGELVFESGELRGFQQAFKDGVLYALTVVLAGFGDLAQSLASGGGFGVYIIGDEDVHGRERLLWRTFLVPGR